MTVAFLVFISPCASLPSSLDGKFIIKNKIKKQTNESKELLPGFKMDMGLESADFGGQKGVENHPDSRASLD